MKSPLNHIWKVHWITYEKSTESHGKLFH